MATLGGAGGGAIRAMRSFSEDGHAGWCWCFSRPISHLKGTHLSEARQERSGPANRVRLARRACVGLADKAATAPRSLLLPHATVVPGRPARANAAPGPTPSRRLPAR